jgi:hypothetical protein
MSQQLTSNETVVLAFLVLACVGSWAVLAVLAFGSARSPLVIGRRETRSKRRESDRFYELSEQFRATAEWMVRAQELSGSRPPASASRYPDARQRVNRIFGQDVLKMLPAPARPSPRVDAVDDP